MLRAVVCKLLFSHSKNELVGWFMEIILFVYGSLGRLVEGGLDDGPEQRAHLTQGRYLACKGHFTLVNVEAPWPLHACSVILGLPPAH